MHKLPHSRGPQLDTDLCVSKIGNRFDLVLVAAVRARELKRQHHESLTRPEAVNSTVSALLEVQEGKIGREYLRKV